MTRKRSAVLQRPAERHPLGGPRRRTAAKPARPGAHVARKRPCPACRRGGPCFATLCLLPMRPDPHCRLNLLLTSALSASQEQARIAGEGAALWSAAPAARTRAAGSAAGGAVPPCGRPALAAAACAAAQRTRQPRKPSGCRRHGHQAPRLGRRRAGKRRMQRRSAGQEPGEAGAPRGCQPLKAPGAAAYQVRS